MGERARRAARECVVFVFFLALACAFTWPLPAELGSVVADRGDPVLNASILDWVCHNLTHDPLHLFNVPIFHPARMPLAFSEHMTGIAILVLPFHLAGVSAIALHNIAMLLSFALAGYGMFVLARLVTRDAAASLMAGVLFAFAPFKFDHLAHVQVIASGWIPLTLAALIAFWRSGAKRDATLFAAALVMNALTNVYWMLFAGFAVGVTIVFLHIVARRPMRRLAFAIAGAAIVVLPFLIPYAIVSRDYKMQRTSIEARSLSATPQDWLSASPVSAMYGWTATDRVERRLFPGVLAIVLALLALKGAGRGARGAGVRSRLLIAAVVFAVVGCVVAALGRITIGSRSFSGSDVPFMIAVVFAIAALPLREMVVRVEIWIASIWIAIGFIGSLGEHSFLHSFLFRVIEPFRATRAPARWAVIAYVGLAMLAAYTAARFRKRQLTWLLLAMSIVEAIPRISWTPIETNLPPVYAWLAKRKPRAALELPIAWSENEVRYVLATTSHRVPILNGVSGFEPPLHDLLSKHRYDADFLRIVKENGGEIVIVHPAAAERARPWIESGALKLMKRFPDGDAACEIN